MDKNLQRYSIISLFSLIGVFVLWFLFNYSLITVSSRSSVSKVVFFDNKTSEPTKELLDINNSHISLIKRGDYSIKVSSGDELTVYERTFGGFWLHKLDMDTQPQKKSSFVNKSFFPCVNDHDNQQIFAFCLPYRELGVIDPDSSVISTDLALRDNHGPEGSLVKYGSSYLRLNYFDKKLTLTSVTNTDEKNVIDYLGGQPLNEYISVSSDSKNIAIYDPGARKIISFKNDLKLEPSYIELNGYIKDSHEIVLSTTENRIMVFASTSDNHDFGEDDKKHSYIESRIIIVDRRSNEITKDIKLPSNFSIGGNIVGGYNSSIYSTINNTKSTSQLNIIDDGGNIKSIKLLNEAPAKYCWDNDRGFYYLADKGRSIYLYNTANRSARLVYGGLANDLYISDIQCTNNSLYLIFDKTSDNERIPEDEKGFYYYKINDSSKHQGIRIESITPLYFPVGDGVYRADVNTNGLDIKSYIPPSGGVSHLDITNSLVDKLNSLGVYTEGLDITIL